MAYTLYPAATPYNLGEQKYITVTSGTYVTFGKFTSCTGVLAKGGDNLTAVHLVRSTGPEQGPPIDFNYSVAHNVLAILPARIDFAKIVGFCNDWTRDVPAFLFLVKTIAARTTGNAYPNYHNFLTKADEQFRFRARIDDNNLIESMLV